MAHTSYAEKLKQEGIDITLIYSGAHKADLDAQPEITGKVSMPTTSSEWTRPERCLQKKWPGTRGCLSMR
ncbi:scaffold protein [Salmonella enterica subsp. enterica]|nr:scaffold protein [Salmonella enterica subsp. enterica]